MSTKPFGAISLTSAPAAKAFSEPVTTMARTRGEASISVSASPSSSRSWSLSAFSASGRFSRMRATWSSISTISVS